MLYNEDTDTGATVSFMSRMKVRNRIFLRGRRHIKKLNNPKLLPMEDVGEVVGTGQLIMA